MASYAAEPGVTPHISHTFASEVEIDIRESAFFWFCSPSVVQYSVIGQDIRRPEVCVLIIYQMGLSYLLLFSCFFFFF